MRAKKTIHLSCCTVSAIAGLAVFVGGSVADGVGTNDLRNAGAVLLIIAVAQIFLVRAVRPFLRPVVEIWEAGYEVGMDKGYQEGRRLGHLKVVPIRDVESGQAS